MSEWVRALLANACTEDELASRLDASIERISRRSVFLMVGVDALLAGHPDHALRGRAHQAYARKCKELGLSTAAGEEAPMKRNLVNFTRGSQLLGHFSFMFAAGLKAH
jgi:LmbE family N-acetylglucosaminyl deacetylase